MCSLNTLKGNVPRHWMEMLQFSRQRRQSRDAAIFIYHIKAASYTAISRLPNTQSAARRGHVDGGKAPEHPWALSAAAAVRPTPRPGGQRYTAALKVRSMNGRSLCAIFTVTSLRGRKKTPSKCHEMRSAHGRTVRRAGFGNPTGRPPIPWPQMNDAFH